jgi:hypothetical protein
VRDCVRDRITDSFSSEIVMDDEKLWHELVNARDKLRELANQNLTDEQMKEFNRRKARLHDAAMKYAESLQR